MHWMPAAVLTLSLPAAPAPLQEGAALFDAPLVTLGAGDRYGFLTDLDHDGFQDAVSWWWANPDMDVVRVRGWCNDGTGKLVLAWSTSVEVDPNGVSGDRSLRLLPCELDSDGDTDICLAYYSSYAVSVRVLRSRGLLSPELVSDYSVTSTLSSGTGYLAGHAVVADFTGDGLADLAYTVDGRLRLMEFVPGEAGLTLRSSTTPFGTLADVVEGLLPIDANGDATPDLLAWRDGTVQLIEIQGCQPTATQTFFPGIVDYKPATGDLDGDGDRDLVLWGPSTFVVARRTGPASWALEPAVSGGPSEFLFDVDRDGDLDGVCCGGGGGPSTPENTELSTFRVSVNDGTGAFAPAIERPWLGSDHLAGIADLDHDGDLDVVSGRCILYSRGPLAEPPVQLGSAQTERTTADVDGDSDPDFTVGLRTMKRNLGDGRTSDHAASFPAPPPGTTFVGPGYPGDFDGDGDVDLVVKHRAGGTLLSQRLLVNLGGGAFADAGEAGPSGVDFNPNYQSGNVPEASLVADADGDGDIDLITRAYVGTYRSLFWWNDGAGHFTAGPGFLDEHISWIGDLTGDGIPDLAGSWPQYPGATYGDVGWHAGLGGGAFGSRVDLSPYAYQGVRFAVADLDADGDLDLAIAFLFDLNVYWNDGGGAFTVEEVPGVALSNAYSAHKVWSTDANGDGRLDLLVNGSERESNAIVVILRRANDSGWETPFAQVVHPNSYFDGLVCDVDGDGDGDFATDRLFRNTTRSLPDAGRRRQVGAGAPGTGELVPTLGADGPFRVGESSELLIRGGCGGASGLLTITLVRGGEGGPGGSWIASTSERILARVPFSLSGTAGTAGTGSWSLPFTVGLPFAHQTRRYVAEIYDPGAPGGVARSNELVITYGPYRP